MKFRAGNSIWAIILLLGAYLLFITWQSEKKLGEGAGETPVPITVEELESGAPANPYRTIGPQVPLLALVIYQVDAKDGTILEAWYPIVPKARFDAAISQFKARHQGNLQAVSREEMAAAMHVKVLVKTRAYTTTAALQAAVDGDKLPHDQVTGLVLNRVSPLGEKEIAFLKEQYPNFNPDQAVFFDTDRTPTPASTLTKYLLGATGCVLLALALLFGPDKKAAA